MKQINRRKSMIITIAKYTLMLLSVFALIDVILSNKASWLNLVIIFGSTAYIVYACESFWTAIKKGEEHEE